MIEQLTTLAERKAQEAEKFVAFDGINLLGLKRKIETILGLIGRDGIFDEYTIHDISHIDAMLTSLKWLIPETTKAIMSPADWLMLVLAIYFHDMGMLVTRDEYANRNSSGFPEFCETHLFSDDLGIDYKAKVDQLGPEASQRFLYQEFVRHMHAVRVRDWVMGKASEKFGFSHQAMTEVSGLLETLDPQFRRDLGLVCESHHLDNLNVFKKYKVSQPYGNSDNETVNLQYVAILLRTADLLHITRDRTPSLVFRLINPSDPISQLEWAKQRAVKSVRSQIARNREGFPDENAPRDTIEVHAFFTNPDGFFGLTSYLDYAESQLRKSFEWAQEASKTQGARHAFPWKYIDDSSIETSGFLKESFKFTIDQAKILDLLTGHTLYNETSVVLRELVQNSLDAIRLRLHIGAQGGFSDAPGSVSIHWDSAQRVLSIVDNGTGMTQSTVEKHLLKVGASKYQDPDFKKQFPDFSSISRFGIGVLSTFMVADNVEIITSHPDEEQARTLNLRSVHGKYLIQLLEKSDEGVPDIIKQHGTCVRLHVRPSATMDDVVNSARRWIVVPQCDVTVTVDESEPIKIGFSSPKDALYAAIDQTKKFVRWDSRESDDKDRDYRTKVRVEEVNTGSGTIAFALRWYEYFDEWAFVQASELPAQDSVPWTGTCVEGIRVDFNPPGYQDPKGVAAIVNASGANAPKTNVARSGLERTPEFEELLRCIYSSYCDHVRNESTQMQARKSFSLTWAAQESRWLLQLLLGSKPTSHKALIKEVYRLPLILAEREGTRLAFSVQELQDEEEFWTIDGQFFRSAERLIREVSSSASLGGIIRALEVEGLELPTGTIICDTAVGRSPYNAVFDRKEVSKIRIDRQQRRLDLKWTTLTEPPRWCRMPDSLWDIPLVSTVSGNNLRISLQNVEIEGNRNETAVLYGRVNYILPDSELANYLIDILDSTESGDERTCRFAACVFILIERRLGGRVIMETIEFWRNDFAGQHGIHIMDGMDFETFMRILGQDELFRVFDPSRWSRKEDI